LSIVKVKHDDILRVDDVKSMLELLDALQVARKPVLYSYKDKEGKQQTEEITVHYGMIKALVCILYLFGKRITEVLGLKRKDLWTKYGYLYVAFNILKKKSRTELAMPKRKVKRVSVKAQHIFVSPIIDYVKGLTDMEMPLFPGRSYPHTRIIRVKDKETGEIKKEYRYEFKREGLMSRVHAYKVLKGLNIEAYPHWFRHSLATELAELGFTPHELKDWFDWSKYETAVHYVEGMPSMTERISKRKVA